MSTATNSYIMILENEEAIIPVAENAFQICQYNHKTVDEVYRGARIYSRDGNLRTIKKISVGDLWGDTLFRKAISLLSSAYKIQVDFDGAKIVGLEEFKKVVANYIALDSKKADPSFLFEEPIDVVVSRIANASSHKEVFEVINFPDADECLDVL